MEHLTQKTGVVIPNVAPAPKEGYKVCVFEETQGTTNFITIINPGESPIKKIIPWMLKKICPFLKDKKYKCFAVSCDVNLNFTCELTMKLASQIDEFILGCHVYYRVTDPEYMARMYNSDPILRMQKEIARQLQENILKSRITIDDVLTRFYDIEDKVLTPFTFKKLSKFFNDFGAILEKINMVYTIPENYLSTLKKDQEMIEEQHDIRNKYKLEKEKKQYQYELQDQEKKQEVKQTHQNEQIEDIKSIHQFQRDLPKRVINALDNAIESIDGAGSLEVVSNTAINTVKNVIQEFGGVQPREPGNQIKGIENPYKELSQGENEKNDHPCLDTSKQLSQISTAIKGTSLPPADIDDALACIHHLQAEFMRKEKKEMSIIQLYADQLLQILLQHRQLFNHNLLEQIKELKDGKRETSK